MKFLSPGSVVTSLCAATAILRNVGTFPTTQQTNPSPYDYDLGNTSPSELLNDLGYLDNSSEKKLKKLDYITQILDNSKEKYEKYGEKEYLKDFNNLWDNDGEEDESSSKEFHELLLDYNKSYPHSKTTKKDLTTTEKASTTTEYLTTTEKSSTTTEKASTTTEETLTTTKNAPTTTEEPLTTTGKILITAASSLIIATITVALYTLKKYFYNSPEEQVLDMKELDFFKIKDNVNNEDNTVDLMAETTIDGHLE
ncbi:MAG: hypothetical protein QMO91_03775 [Candidatus Tisiphia sp.]|nr:hypothetical protein [Candidatus Tisiphia sp.]